MNKSKTAEIGLVAGLPGLRARLKWTAVRARYKDVVLARNLQCVVAEAAASRGVTDST